MQYKNDILRFTWGDYPAIGIKHFEDRRNERFKNGTNIFNKSNLSTNDVLLNCFDILYKEKYLYILGKIKENHPHNTEWIVGFQTDEFKNDKPIYIFIVFSISKKETPMNDINKGDEFLCCITIVKDTFKKSKKINSNIKEETLCYYKDLNSYNWKININKK